MVRVPSLTKMTFKQRVMKEERKWSYQYLQVKHFREGIASAKVLHYNNTKHVRKSKEADVGNRTHGVRKF